MRDAPIFLVGFMGSGKSTIGRLLAAKLDWTFHDLDEHIEAAAGRSIAEIFASDGEAVFRRIEREALRAVVESCSQRPQQVLALGGGAFVQPDNLQYLQASPVISIFLDVPFQEVYRRCSETSGRPLFQNPAAFRALFESRLPVYRQASHTVDASAAPEQVAERILALLPSRPAPVSRL